MKPDSVTYNKYGFSPGNVYRRNDRLYYDNRNAINKFIGLDTNNLGRAAIANAEVSTFKGCDIKYVTTGTSVFDAYLSYLMTYWFSPVNGKVIDPFAGGLTRGAVCSMLWRKYTGIDLSQKQIDANNNTVNDALKNNIQYICDDSLCYKVDDVYDFLITCPPYYSLERYSKDERDLSNKSIDDFNKLYSSIITKYIQALRDRSFAVVVVGDYHHNKRYMLDAVTIDAAQDAGAYLYDVLYINNEGPTSSLTGSHHFRHFGIIRSACEKALIFYKGEVGDAASRFNELLEINEYNGTFLKPIDCINRWGGDC